MGCIATGSNVGAKRHIFLVEVTGIHKCVGIAGELYIGIVEGYIFARVAAFEFVRQAP